MLREQRSHDRCHYHSVLYGSSMTHKHCLPDANKVLFPADVNANVKSSTALFVFKKPKNVLHVAEYQQLEANKNLVFSSRLIEICHAVNCKN